MQAGENYPLKKAFIGLFFEILIRLLPLKRFF